MAASTLALPLACAALLGVALLAVALAVALRAERRRTTHLLRDLAERVEARPAGVVSAVAREEPTVAEFLITDIGTDRNTELESSEARVSDAVVLGAAFGEPLLRSVALVHGLRRALSAESRNRIRFEVRREVRRARRRRRQEMKDAWQRVRAEDGSAA